MIEAFTCLLKPNIAKLVRVDSAASRIISPQLGQKSPVTSGMRVDSPL
jgi:hypothetical protein